MTVADLTAAYPAFNCHLAGTSIVPNTGPGSSFSFILAVPIVRPRATVAMHITGTFNVSTSLHLVSALSADATGYATSFEYFFAGIFTDPVLTTQTIDVTFGTGLEEFDAAVTAGELYVELDVGRGTSVDAVTYEVVVPNTHAPPLRQHPRSDGLGASSAPRLYPPAPSIQASLRRAGGYL